MLPLCLEMEKAIFVSKIGNLKYISKDYSRLYFGNEFCQRLIPSLKELKKVLNFSQENNLDFTFVTPYVTNGGLDNLKSLLPFLSKQNPCEVVINDWGVLRLINKNYQNLKPVLGRLLGKQKRGPRIMNVWDKLPKTAKEYFRQTSITVPRYRNFLKERGIRRIELDNLLQGIDLGFNAKKEGIYVSLYLPYAYVTTTRLCLTANCDKPEYVDKIGIFPCHKECQKYTFELKHKAMPVTLILKGNTQFFKNEKIPENLEKKGIDRIVYQLEIPM